MRRGFCAPPVKSDGLGVAMDDIIVDAVLEVLTGRTEPAQSPGIRLVLTEQKLWKAVAIKPQSRQPRMIDRDRMIVITDELWLHRIRLPRPCITRPELRQDVQRRRLSRAIGDRNPHQDVVDIGLGVFDLDIKISVLVEHSGVDQLELRLALPA